MSGTDRGGGCPDAAVGGEKKERDMNGACCRGNHPIGKRGLLARRGLTPEGCTDGTFAHYFM